MIRPLSYDALIASPDWGMDLGALNRALIASLLAAGVPARIGGSPFYRHMQNVSILDAKFTTRDAIKRRRLFDIAQLGETLFEVGVNGGHGLLLQKHANPEVAVQTSRDRGAFGEAYGQSISIGVRFPFGANDRQLAKAALAGAERTEAETVLANERERLAAEAQAAAARVLGARGVVSATEQRAALARDSRGFFDKAFRLGQADLPTRLRIELEAAEAERQLARARIELFHAISALRQTLGLMPE